MKGRKKHNKWVTAIAIIASVAAIYYAFNIGRGIYYNNRGTAHMAEGEYEQAISCFGKALKVRRKFPEAYCNRGTVYSDKGEYDQAIPDFNKAIELNPEFADAYYNRAVVYYYKKEYDKAWADVHKAQSLGHQIPTNFIEALREISGRKERFKRGRGRTKQVLKVFYDSKSDCRDRCRSDG
jgi:tetratricopeptide (TPR) repeat protein